MANESEDRHLDPGTRQILEELRDLRVEAREDRRRSDEDRKRADEDRKRSDEDRKRSDERFELMLREMRGSNERFERTLRETSRETREHFDRTMREFREDSARREAATQKVVKDVLKELRTDVRTVGLAIVKTLNRHTRLLEGIDRKLGARDNGRPGRGNGRGA